MGEAAPLVVFALVGIASFVMSYRASLNRARDWRRAAEACGLVGIEEDWGVVQLKGITARAEDLYVRLESYERNRKLAGTRIVIESFGQAALAPIVLCAESTGTAIDKWLG